MAKRPTQGMASNALYWSTRANTHDAIGEGYADTLKTRPMAREGGANLIAPKIPLDKQMQGAQGNYLSTDFQQSALVDTPSGVVQRLAQAVVKMGGRAAKSAPLNEVAATGKAAYEVAKKAFSKRTTNMNKPHPDPQNSKPGANSKGGNSSLPNGKPLVMGYDRYDPRAGRKVHVGEYANPKMARGGK